MDDKTSNLRKIVRKILNEGLLEQSEENPVTSNINENIKKEEPVKATRDIIIEENPENDSAKKS